MLRFAVSAAFVAVLSAAFVVLFWPAVPEDSLPVCWEWLPPITLDEPPRFVGDRLCRARRPPPTWLYDPMFAAPKK